MINQAKATINVKTEADREEKSSACSRIPESINQNSSENCCQNPISNSDSLAPPSTLLGRTLSASAVDYRGTWRNKKLIPTHEKNAKSQHQVLSSSDGVITSRISGIKRKYSSQDGYLSAGELRLPNFTHSPNLQQQQMFKPTAAMSIVPEFITPQPKKLSRPNSPSSAGFRPVLPRGRVASIRRESDCSTENEAAHEKMIKSSQQVSVGFEDFCLDDKMFEERKRAKSLTEPISVFTNAFLPQSSSPSPTRGNVDSQKQCYSPSTQQVVRSNISYSPSPSPTPGSPCNRMRSMSPITVRQISKRRYTGSVCGNGSNGNGSGLESDGESSASSMAGPTPKRQCTAPTTGNIAPPASPLIRDSTHHLQQHFTVASLVAESFTSHSAASISSTELSTTSPLNVSSNNLAVNPVPTAAIRPHLLIDPKFTAQCYSSSSIEANEEDEMAEDDGPLMSSFCSNYDAANSSTTFSSRANTPQSEMLDNLGAENEISALNLPHPSSCSSDGSSRSSLKMPIKNQPVKENEKEFKERDGHIDVKNK